MAPDAASLANGRKLADAAKWRGLGLSDSHAWGEIQGSGSKAYQTCIEFAEPAFHCSCPSRKFPCKHGLGLALLFAERPKALASAEPPAWVAEWADKRANREQKKARRAAAAVEPEDEATLARRAQAQEKRAGARLDSARGGLAFLELWLADLLRQGLASQADQPYRHWDELAARMVDAQVPGLARHLRRLPELRHEGTHWQAPFLDTLARLHLLSRGFARYDQLDPALRGDIDAALGLPQSKESVMQGEAIADRWLALGSRSGEADGLRYQRTWLHGQNSGRAALLLDFAARNQVLPGHPPVGSEFDGELVFYPSAWPQRALIKTQGNPSTGDKLPAGHARCAGLQDAYADALAQLPWLERFPALLRAVTPLWRDQRWLLVDADGAGLPLAPACSNAWELLAVSGGQPLDVFAEFDGDSLLPLTYGRDGQLQTLPEGSERVPPQSVYGQLEAWKQVVTAALLGSERQQLGVRADGALGIDLAHIYPDGQLPAAGEARPRALLDAAALLAGYQRAGQQAPTLAQPLPAPSAADTRPAVSTRAGAYLRQILDDNGAATLRDEWLDATAARGRRCPPLLLPRLLNAVAGARQATAALLDAAGERGRWLLAARPEWAALTQRPGDGGDIDPARWDEGTFDERLALLQRLRATRPDEARALVEAAIAAEAAAQRAALVAALETGLDAGDEEFLNLCLDDKSQEVRQRAAGLLSRLPGSALRARVAARLGAWLNFETKTGLLGRLGGRKGALTVTLPDAWEASWLRDGLVEKPPRGKGPKAWWLEQSLGLLPPAHWTQTWNTDAETLLELTAEHEWRDSLINGWRQATLRHADADWAAAFLTAGASDDAEALWPVLSRERREAVYMALMKAADPKALFALMMQLPLLPSPWSAAFSRDVIGAWQRLAGKTDPGQDYRIYTVLRESALRLAPDQYPAFESALARLIDTDGPWSKVLGEVRERLRFRHDMIAAIGSDE